MKKRGRIGSLSPGSYFPRTGDILTKGKEVWQCLRQNNVVNEGTTVRYSLLIGKSVEWDDYTSYEAFTDNDDFRYQEWIKGIETIIRPKSKGNGSIAYYWNKSTKTWRQDVE